MSRKAKRQKLLRKPIVFAADLPDCPDCGEKWCPEHKKHYSECACIGPHSAEDEGYQVVEFKGQLVAEKRV
jgi:hypothetical protein